MPEQNIYRVTIESGVNDDTKRQVRVFYIREEDDELLWHLLTRIGVSRDKWSDQQQRRTEEEFRKTRERQWQEEQRRRKAQEDFYRFVTNNNNWHFNFGDFRSSGNGPGPTFTARPSEPQASYQPKTPKEQLADMAGVDWGEAKTMDNKKLLRRAQRKCHPDHGGTHQQWLDLQKLQNRMGI